MVSRDIKYNPKTKQKIGGAYSDNINLHKPVQKPVIIPKLKSKITEDKLKVFVDFKF